MRNRIAAAAASAVLVAAFATPAVSAVGLAEESVTAPSSEAASDPSQPDMAEPDMAEPDADPAGAEPDTDPAGAEPDADPATPEVPDPAQTDLTGADPVESDATDLTEVEGEVEPCSSVPGPNPNSCAQLTFPECTAWSVDFARFGVGHCNDAAEAAGKGRPYTIEQCTASGVWERKGTNDVQDRQRYTCTIPPQVTGENIQLTSMCRPSATEASLRVRGPVGASWRVSKYGSSESYDGVIPEAGELLQAVPWASSGDTWILTVTGTDGTSARTTKAVGDNERCAVEPTPISIPFVGIAVPASGLLPSVPAFVGLVPATPFTPVPAAAPATAPQLRTQPLDDVAPALKGLEESEVVAPENGNPVIQHRPADKDSDEDAVKPAAKADSDPAAVDPSPRRPERPSISPASLTEVIVDDPVFPGASEDSSEVSSLPVPSVKPDPVQRGDEASADASPAQTGDAPLVTAESVVAAGAAILAALWFMVASRRRMSRQQGDV